jgi:GTP-binding protein
MPAVFKAHEHWSTKVRTKDLNDWLAMATARHPPPAVNGRRIKPRYIAQTKARPPTFVLMASRADQLPESYKRYLINSMRESFELPGTPIRLTVKSGKNPYAAGEAKGGPAPRAYNAPVSKPKPAQRQKAQLEAGLIEGKKPKAGAKSAKGPKSASARRPAGPKARPSKRPSRS